MHAVRLLLISSTIVALHPPSSLAGDFDLATSDLIGGPYAIDGAILVASRSAAISVAASSGEVLWRVFPGHRIERAMTGSHAFYVAGAGCVSRIEAGSGRVTWTRAYAGLNTHVVEAGSHLIVSAIGAGIRSHTGSSTVAEWIRSDLEVGHFEESGCDSLLAVSMASVDASRLITSLDPASGKTLWSSEIAGSAVPPLVVRDGTTLVVAEERSLVRVDCRSGTTVSRQALPYSFRGPLMMRDGWLGAVLGDGEARNILWSMPDNWGDGESSRTVVLDVQVETGASVVYVGGRGFAGLAFKGSLRSRGSRQLVFAVLGPTAATSIVWRRPAPRGKGVALVDAMSPRIALVETGRLATFNAVGDEVWSRTKSELHELVGGPSRGSRRIARPR